MCRAEDGKGRFDEFALGFDSAAVMVTITTTFFKAAQTGTNLPAFTAQLNKIYYTPASYSSVYTSITVQYSTCGTDNITM